MTTAKIDEVCGGCGANLSGWNTGYAVIRHCPNCGVRLPGEQDDWLWRQTTRGEPRDMICARIEEYLEYLEDDEEVNGGDCAYALWERENIDGVVFYSNSEADLFAFRHLGWVRDAFEHLADATGEGLRYAQIYTECVDRFLVCAFIEATEHYLHDQLELDRNKNYGGKELRELLSRTDEIEYDGEF